MEETILHSGLPEPDENPEETAIESSPLGLDDAPAYAAGAGPAPAASDDETAGARAGGPLQLAWNAMLLRESAFQDVLQSESPLRTGLTVLVIALVIAAVGQGIGAALDVATTPPLADIQAVVTEQLREAPQLGQLMRDPQARRVFETILDGVFRAMRFFTPTWGGALASLCLSPVLGVLGWGVYGLLTQVSARIFGGRANAGRFLGAMALAYAPVLLRVANILPGTVAVNGLVGWWVLATSYLAVKTTHELTWSRSLGAVLAPRIIVWIVVFGCVLVSSIAAPMLLVGGGA